VCGGREKRALMLEAVAAKAQTPEVGESTATPPGESQDETTLLPNTNVSVAPPYWTRHSRTVSNASYHSIGQHGSGPILLEDHSAEGHELAQGCWAKSATIDEHVLVSGPTGIGAYVVWLCTVKTLKGGDVIIRKR
jgi:hypothetical protein